MTLSLAALDRLSVAPVAESATAVQIADLGGKLLVAWTAGARSGLRIRLAAPEQFAQARDVVVYDDHLRGGADVKDSTLDAFTLVAGEGVAALLLEVGQQMHVVRIDPNGTVTPWPVAVTP
jgi:hypothetical protein